MVTFTITPTANGCPGTPVTTTVTVNPTAQVDLPTNQVVCNGGSTAIVTFATTNIGGTTSYSWTNNTTSIGLAALGNGNIPVFSAVNVGTTPVTATIVVTPTFNNGSVNCTGPTKTFTISVNPTAQVNLPTNQVVCNGSPTSVNFSTTNSGGTTSYSWTNNATSIGLAASGNGNIPSFNAVNIGTTPVTATITVTPTFNNGSVNCSGPSQIFTITIDPSSIGGNIFIEGTTERTKLVCYNSVANPPLILSGFTGNIVKWQYSTNSGVLWTDITNTTTSQTYDNLTATRIYRAILKSGSCSEVPSAVAIISVVPTDVKPDPVTVSASTICLNQSLTFNSTSGFATGSIIESGGDFQTSNPKDWLADGCGNCLNSGSSSTVVGPFRLSATNGGNYSGIDYASIGKFAIANGNVGGNSYLETPVFNLLGLNTAKLQFDHAYNLLAGATAKVEISMNGGATYTTVLASFTGPSTLSPYNNFPNMEIDLSSYIGQTNLRIRFNYFSNNASSWAIDNIKIPDRPVNENIIWTNEHGIIVSNSASYTETPTSPGAHTYTVTSYLNGCNYAITPQNSVQLTVNVNFAYAGHDILVATDDCGNNRVALNAYDNSKSAAQNIAKGAYNNNYVTDTSPGTNALGKWTIATSSTCGAGTFSTNNPGKYSDPTNDPDAIFTGETGNYVLRWTVAGCSIDEVSVTLTGCESINFDGTNDYITFEDNFDLTPEFSIEVWVKPNAVIGTQTIFSKRNANNLATGYDLKLSGDKISFNWNAAGTIASTFGITTNRWYHIAVTFDGTYKLYIDGIEVATSGSAQSAPGANAFECILGAMGQNGAIPINHFNGWMDELRIWNTALNPDQMHQMMNQQILSNGTAVRGEILQIDVNGLSWTTNLLGYYRMNQINCGYMNSFKVGDPNGKLRNITSPQDQTAPIPYTTKGNGNWNDTTALTPWTYGNSVWDYPNSKGVNGADINWNIVRTGHNVISNTQDLTLLGLLVDANKLTITGAGTQDENNPGHGLWITHYLKLDGVIDLVGESQLVQKRYGVYDTNFPYDFSTTQFSESIFEPTSSGYIERDQQGKKNSFNYNYWSSPVTRQGAANNAPYTVANVLRDGTNSAIPRAINFVDGAYSADTPNGLNPIKITSRWIWTYRATIGADPWANYYQWVNVGYWGSINVGDGYTMKGTGGYADVTVMQNYVFIGKPNSGDITTTQLNHNQTYLIGNPYPSALDANEFIKNNLNVFDGSLRFWDHFGLSNNHLLAQYEGGYATYNLSGGVPGASNVLLTASTGEVSSKIPERYIPVGQGFFVDADDTTTPGNLNFNNNQRVFKREVVTGLANSGSVFMKTATSKKSNTQEMQETTADTRPKIRLTFISSLGYHRPLLVTMDKNTSNQFDIGYDAPLNENNKEDMFWQLGQRKLVIQGVNNFDTDQELPLGIKIAKTGLATIKIHEVQYIDENITIHIKDKFTGKTHNISHKPFEIELEPGTYLDRFALIFKYQKLVAEDLGTDILLVEPVTEDSNYQIFMNNAIAELQIKNNGTDEIRSITLFNILGQTMITWNKELNRRIISLPVKLATGVYMVQINTINGSINKRIIIE
jgi:hypothetical protein